MNDTPSSLQHPVDLTAAVGLGVAGNFTGHLEQAGEASDFVGVAAAAGAPKGVFPFYLPPGSGSNASGGGKISGGGKTSGGFLHTFPLSTDTIEHPGPLGGQPAQLQIEPELALLCRLHYAKDGAVAAVEPTHFNAYNDCSTRRPDATKISQKKNWGPATKGLAASPWIELDTFAPAGVLDRFRLACFLRRDGALHAYGEDSPVAGPDGYGYMYGRLLDWLVDRLNHQTDHGPLEHLAQRLADAGRPPHAVISIGATRYTELGETTFLQPGDEAIVVAYDAQAHQPSTIAGLIGHTSAPGIGTTLAVLRQRVVARPASPRKGSA
jgi:hypothetical protein